MGRRFESCRAHHNLQTLNTSFPTKFPTNCLRPVYPLLCDCDRFENRVRIEQLNGLTRGAARNMRIVPHHARAHVSDERLDYSEGNTKFDHVSDERVPQIVEAQP